MKIMQSRAPTRRLPSVLRLLVLAVVLLGACEREVPPRRDTLSRAELEKKRDTDPRALPRHGMVLHEWGMEGDSLIVLDADAQQLLARGNRPPKYPTQRTRTFDRARVDSMMRLGEAAWTEVQTGPMPDVTDVREDLFVLDGDVGFYLTNSQIAIDDPMQKTGRPAASRAARAMYDAAE